MEVKYEVSEASKLKTKENQTGVSCPYRPASTVRETHMHRITIVQWMSVSRTRLPVPG